MDPIIWRKTAVWYAVQVEVGGVWFQQAHKETEAGAVKAAQRLLDEEPTVSAARVQKHVKVHECFAVWPEVTDDP